MRDYWLFRNSANIITATRFFSTLGIIWIGIFDYVRLDIFSYLIAYGIISDWVDGIVAKKLKIQSLNNIFIVKFPLGILPSYSTQCCKGWRICRLAEGVN